MTQVHCSVLRKYVFRFEIKRGRVREKIKEFEKYRVRISRERVRKSERKDKY